MREQAVLADATIVVVGGGAVGTGIAYSLAIAGHTDVLVIEREPGVGAVTTSQAAGLVGQVRADPDRVRLAMWSVETFGKLEAGAHAGAEITPGWRQPGSLRIARTAERADDFDRLLGAASQAGLEVHRIGAAEATRYWPGMDFADATSILHCPSDGYLQPTDLAATYRYHARQAGVRFATGTELTGIAVRDGRVCGVSTTSGDVRCEWVVNAAGAHAYHVARLVGLELPIVPVRHHMFCTVGIDGVVPTHPVVRAVDGAVYIRPEINGILVGGWEQKSLSADPRTFALDQPAPALDEDWPVLGEFAAQAADHLPQVTDVGVRSTFRGWPTFTPDGRFLIGESCRVPGFVMAGGCNAHGVSGSAGIGHHVVESMFDRDPSPYVRSLSPDRYSETRWDWATARRQAERVYETYYALSTTPH